MAGVRFRSLKVLLNAKRECNAVMKENSHFFNLPFPIFTVSHFPFPFLCSGSPGVSSCTTAQVFVRANQIAEARDVFNLLWIFISYTRKSAMADTSGVHSLHRAIERAVHQLGYVRLKSEQLKVVVGITDGRLWRFCSATSRVQLVLCVFACSVWPAVSKWRRRREAPGTYSGCYSANSNHGRIQDQVYDTRMW